MLARFRRCGLVIVEVLSMSPIFAALISCVLLKSPVDLPEWRRTSLDGFTDEKTGETLLLEEAVARLEARAKPRPGLVRLDPPARALEDHVPGLEIAPPDVPRLDVAAHDELPPVAANDVEACPCGGVDGGNPCVACAERNAREVDAESFEGPDPMLEDRPRAQATVCSLCKGAKKRNKRADDCERCEGYGVRVWIEDVEVIHTAPIAERARIAGCFALADYLREMPATAVDGARRLVDFMLRGAEASTCVEALEQWDDSLERRQAEQT
jgi:hypothetical protein